MEENNGNSDCRHVGTQSSLWCIYLYSQFEASLVFPTTSKSERQSHMVIRECRGIRFLWKKLQRSKGSYTSVLPSASSLVPSCYLVLNSFKAREMPHIQQLEALACHLSSHPSIRDPTLPHIRYMGMAQQEGEDASLPHGHQSGLSPSDRISFLQEMCALSCCKLS